MEYGKMRLNSHASMSIQLNFLNSLSKSEKTRALLPKLLFSSPKAPKRHARANAFQLMEIKKIIFSFTVSMKRNVQKGRKNVKKVHSSELFFQSEVKYLSH